MKPTVLILAAMAPLAACTGSSMTIEQAHKLCDERAREAAGPTGTVFFGVSNTGPVASAEVNISSNYLRGLDPAQVFDDCVFDLTGQGPVRPPNL